MRGVALNPVAAAGGSSTTNGVFLTGRGNCMAIDLVTSVDVPDGFSAVTFTIGGQQIVQNAVPNMFAWNASPGTYRLVRGNFGENQNWQVFAVNQAANILRMFWVEYYENNADMKQFAKYMADQSLATKRVIFANSAPGGTSQTATQIVPLNRGKIFAIEPFLTVPNGAVISDYARQTVSIQVNGVNVLENVPALSLLVPGTRNNLHAISIEPGATITYTLDASGGANTLDGGLSLYFVPDGVKC